MSQADKALFGFRIVGERYVPLESPPPEQREGQSPQEEIREYLEYLVAEKCHVDVVGQAIIKGGISEGYKCYLEGSHKYTMVIVRRTWKDDPTSKEYRIREAAFRDNVLWRLRDSRTQRYKGFGAGPFDDTLKDEHPPLGFLDSDSDSD